MSKKNRDPGDPNVVEVNDIGAYRIELATTLAWCGRIAAESNDRAIRSGAAAEALLKLRERLPTMTILEMENTIFALMEVNPGLVAEAMAKSGHVISKDADGNVHVGQADPAGLIGRPVGVSEFLSI